MSTGELYSELVRKIQGVRRLEHGIAVQTGLIDALTGVIAVAVLALSVEAIVGLEAAGRTLLFNGTIIAAAAIVAVAVLPRLARFLGLLKGQPDDMIARRVGDGIPAVGDRLLNTLQLYHTAATQGAAAAIGYSADLLNASIVSQGTLVRAHDYTVIVERDERRRALLFFLSAATLISTLFLAFPGVYRGALARLIRHDADFTAPAPFRLSIEPGDRTVVRGDSLEIVVQAEGIPPRTVTLRLRSGDAAPQEIELRGDAGGTFRYRFASIKEQTVYSAYAGPVRTTEHTLDVVDRPEIRTLQVSVAHPSYTGRGTETLPPNVGDVAGLRGTTVRVNVTANIEPAGATIVQLFPRGGTDASNAVVSASNSSPQTAPVRYDTVRIPMQTNGAGASGTFRLSRNGLYYIALSSPQGLSNNAPVRFRMSTSSDAPPTIALLEPADSATVDRTMLLPVSVHISDDYGFSRLRIMYRLAFSKYAAPAHTFSAQPMAIPRGGSLSLDVPYVWDMTSMGIVPEDVVEMYAEVYDNDVVGGPKVARTDTIRVRFPSLDEVLQQAEKTQEQATAELNKMLKEAQQQAKEMENLNRELMKEMAQNQQQAGWQNQQKMQELMKQREQMTERLQKMADNLRMMAEKLQEAKAISPETMKKYMDLQKLFDELKNPALLEQMRKLQSEMQKMSPEELAEAMKNFKYNDEQFRKSIERTMNILKRMQAEQKVDEMIRRADELRTQQENLNEQMAQTDPKDDAMRKQLAERQQSLAKNAERMEQEMRDLTKQMEQLGDEAPRDEMQAAEGALEKDSPREGMEQASSEMQKGEMRNAKQQGDRARAAAENFKQKMQAVKKKMQENGRREVMNRMKKSMKDLLDLSKRQEELKNRTEATAPNSQQFRDLAQQQAQLKEQMENLTNQMMSLGQKTFAVTPEMGKELGNAMQQMENAGNSLEQRDGNSASQQEGGAMGSMNNAAKMMGQALGQMQGQKDGDGSGMGMGMGSMQQRLQQMAAQQQMINQAMGQQGQGQQQGDGQQQGQGQKNGKGQGEQEGEDGEQRNGKNGKQGRDGKDGTNGEGGEGTSDAQGKDGRNMGRLTRQQEEVRKSLDELNKEARESGGTRKNVLGDLERTAKEIDQVLSEMRNGTITPETMQRQERILSRLLDAARSQRERDFDKKRESRPGQDVVRRSPPDLKFDGSDASTPVRRDQLDQRNQGYTRDYEYLIRRYFEELGRTPTAQ